MTHDVFLSWSLDDAAAIGPLKDLLADVGLKVWEYSDASQAGGYIPQQVSDAVDAAKVAVICFSDATVDRNWIVTEADWARKSQLDEAKRLTGILPVWVGPHPQNKLPPVLTQAQLNAFDFATPKPNLQKFLDDLFTLLERRAPRVTPAALFAMTDVQCQQVLQTPAIAQELTTLCTAAGVPAGVDVLQLIASRYGANAGAFAPFVAGRTFVELTSDLLREANAIRVAGGRPPVLLKWMEDEIVGPGKQQAARDEWARSHSLLVIDAASSFHPDIQKRLLNLPIPKQPEHAALIWLPPFTNHTAPIEQSLQTAAAATNIGHVDDAFCDWQRRDSLRSMTFDAFTSAGAALWLRRMLLDVEDAALPFAAHVNAMRAQNTARFSLSATMTGPQAR